jgi:phosphate transport system protein
MPVTMLGWGSGEHSGAVGPNDSPEDIDALDGRVARLFALVADGIAAATSTFLASDREAASQLVADEQEVDVVFHCVEGEIRAELLSGRIPSQARLARLLMILQVAPELERSGDLVEHVAWRARQGLARSLTPPARALVERMGTLAQEMWRAAASGYLERDRTAAQRLRRWDDELDDLHVRLTSELATTELPVATAIEMGLVARFLERLGDHAVNVARRLEALPSGV